LAKELQSQDETTAVIPASTGVRLQQDLELAQKLFQEDSRKVVNAKRKQEQQDAALAQRMQQQQPPPPPPKPHEREGTTGHRGSTSSGSHATSISSLTQPTSTGMYQNQNHRRRWGGNKRTSIGPLPRTQSVDETVPIASVPQRRRPARSRRRPSTTGGAVTPSARVDGDAPSPTSSPRPSTCTNVPPRPTTSPAPQKSFFPGANRFFPTCVVCNQYALYYISTLGNHYHPECFKCYGCHKPIDQTKPFAYTTDDLGVKYPLHRPCYAQLYGITCVVCQEPIPTNESGRISYVKHPFFDQELMCPKHTKEKKIDGGVRVVIGSNRHAVGSRSWEMGGDVFVQPVAGLSLLTMKMRNLSGKKFLTSLSMTSNCQFGKK